MSGGGVNVQVSVRCRPLSERERVHGALQVVSAEKESRAVRVSLAPGRNKNAAGTGATKSYGFDHVFGPYDRQDTVFQNTVVPIIDEVTQGYNCTVFAYGQTGTGKTYTMEGVMGDEEHAGIIPRSVKLIFERLESSGCDYNVNVSFLELYNEELADLLDTSSSSAATGDSCSSKRLRLVEDARRGVVCQHLEEVAVLSADDIFQILERGVEQRRVAETLLNKNSSRSHCIFTLKIMIKETTVDGEEFMRHGQLNLVDLAGSECIGRSGAKNARAREAGTINQSLLTLGRVITALVDGHGHVPYRDSKLTRLLQESLGGRARTCIIATISPSSDCADETLSTLDYAFRARNIRNRPEVNQRMTKRTVMKEYAAEVEALKHALQITREKNGVWVDPAEFEQLNNRVETQEHHIRDLEQAFREREEENKALQEAKVAAQAELKTTQQSLRTTETQRDRAETGLARTRTHLHHTRVEFLANRTLVQQQANTEVQLHEQATARGEQLVQSREHIDALCARADAHEQFEETKREEAHAFHNNLQGITAELRTSIDAMRTSSTKQSDYLCDGVSTLVSQGRTTCDVMKKAVDEALETLTTDADNVSNQMTTTLAGLDSHLQTTNAQATTVLEGVRDSLLGFFSALEGQLSSVEQLVQEQRNETSNLQASIAQHHEVLDESIATFVKAHQAELDRAHQRAEQMHAALQAQQAAQTREREELLRAHSEAMQAKAADVQAAVTRLMQEFTDLGQTHQHAVQTHVQAAEMQASDTISEGVAAVKDAVTASGIRAAAWGAEVQQQQSSHIDACQAKSSAIDSLAGRMLETKGDMFRRLGEQTEQTPVALAQVAQDIEQAIDAGRSTVTETSTVAAAIPQNVQAATVKMEQAAGSAVTGFNELLQQTGDGLTTNLRDHFVSLDEFSTSAASGVDHAEQCAATHVAAATTALEHATKKPERPDSWPELEPLPATEEHSTVVNRARSTFTQEKETALVTQVSRNLRAAAALSVSAVELGMVGGETPIATDFSVEAYREHGIAEFDVDENGECQTASIAVVVSSDDDSVEAAKAQQGQSPQEQAQENEQPSPASTATTEDVRVTPEVEKEEMKDDNSASEQPQPIQPPAATASAPAGRAGHKRRGSGIPRPGSRSKGAQRMTRSGAPRGRTAAVEPLAEQQNV